MAYNVFSSVILACEIQRAGLEVGEYFDEIGQEPELRFVHVSWADSYT